MKIHTIQVNIGDLQGGTNHMDNAEFGAYFSLLMCCYQSKDHFIPTDDVRLARMAKCTLKGWIKVKNVVLEKFTISDSKMTQNRVQNDAEKYQEKSQINRNNALKIHNSSLPVASESHSERNAIQYTRPKTHNTKKDIIYNIPIDVPESVWKDFVSHRKAKKAPVTETAINGIRKESVKAGITLEQALEISITRGWTSFKAEWMKDNGNYNSKPVTGHAAHSRVLEAATAKMEQDRLQGKAAPSTPDIDYFRALSD